MDPCEVLRKRRKIAFKKGETSSSDISKNDYEVFLSFRGPDTRQGLTDCLYHAMVDAGIRVFRDDDELVPGDKIDEILIALDNSKISIVILSPKFAESAWCLREVERMVNMKKDIVPIFCYVSPDDVKLKTELYANALTMHENKYGKDRVQLWREALKEIPTIKGRALKNTGFIEFSRHIAKEILTKLKVNHKLEIDNFVDVPDEVEAALKLLDIGSRGCRFLAIHGMGGIGKSTLAKTIFNQISDSFDCSCFLENIRENLSQSGLKKLQEQLLRSIDPSQRDAAHIIDAIGKIKNNFTRKKVLIVLDDIDHKNHIRDLVGSFGSGSRIIFTSRNAKLHEQGTSCDAHFYSLEKNEMDSKQALKLFSRHAFGEDSPPKDFENLSAEAISTTGGLPLALEVVGSFLHRRKAKVWRDMIKKLKEAPHQDVQARLKISYDALDEEQQEIFLDIACFFIGEEKSNALYMWEACEFDPNYGIEVLISMSLIKLKEKKCFWMHDQLRDLGRAIVKLNSKDDKAGSRVLMHKEALDLLKTNTGKEKVEALHLYGPSNSLDRENFVGLEQLRYLQFSESEECADLGDFGGLLQNVRWPSLSVSANFCGLFPKLRWLSLKDVVSFNATSLCLRELVVLELSWCWFNESWQGWGQILISNQLKVLTLSRCHGLISMSDLSKIVNLERLSLLYCDKLTHIHSSIGKLQCLRSLTIIGCKFLHELPESIGCLVSLTRLELDSVANLPNSFGKLVKLKHLSLRSYELSVLPNSIGDLRSLVSLDLRGSGITELPSTISRLAKLESLFLARCSKLQRLPDSIGNLHSLIDLDISDTSIVELPHSFGNLASLQKLNLSVSSVTPLQDITLDFIGDLRSLVSLDLRGSRITELPSTIGRLAKLESLCLAQCSKLQRLPDSIGNLHSLIDLDMSDTFTMVELPHSFGNLASLQKFNLSGSDAVPISFRGLEKLERFDIGYCSFYHSICCIRPHTIPVGFTSLEIGCRYVHGDSKFYFLRIDNQKWYIPLDGIEKLIKLEELSIQCYGAYSRPLEWGALQQLKSLKVKCEDVEFGECQLPLSLESLDLNVYEKSQLPVNFCSLKNLTKLRLSKFEIEEADSIGELESLEYLGMRNCILKFNDFPVLNRLRCLQLDGVEIVDDIHGIGKLKSLTKLDIRRCDSLQRIEDLSELNGLNYIGIAYCWKFEGIDGIDRLLSAGTLYELTICSCKCEDRSNDCKDAGEDDRELDEWFHNCF